MSKKRDTIEIKDADLEEVDPELAAEPAPPADPEPLPPELEPVSPAVAYPPVVPDAVLVPEPRVIVAASIVDTGNGFHPLTEQAAAKAYAIAAIVLNWPEEQPRWNLLTRDEQAAWVSAASQVT